MSREGSQSSQSHVWPDPHKIMSGDNDPKLRPVGNVREENRLQTRIQHGPFTIYPGFGTVQPGQNAQITVDFGVESVQKYEEFLAIEISDRKQWRNVRLGYAIAKQLLGTPLGNHHKQARRPQL